MRRTTTPLRRLIACPVLLVTLLAVTLVGCGAQGNAEELSVLREPVSTSGANPFTAAVGVDQPGVTAPPNSGGAFPGDTVGLFGGTKSETACDKGQMVAFLQQDRTKAAAWASVFGISVDGIAAFVATLTPAVLRSDTFVINHGFQDGKATEIPAVLQAGTAVLVDAHGAPVTKCFCGNPLKTPTTSITSVTFTGPQWPAFSSNQVTVVAPVTQTVQQFVFVQPGTGQPFQRPAGTAGQQDTPATAPVPTTFPPPPSPVTPPTASGSSTTGSVPPPGIVGPSATPTVSPSALPTTSKSGTVTIVPTTRSSSPSATTPSPSPSPSASPPVVPPGSPSPGSASPGTASPSPSPAPVKASWVVGDCFVRSGRAHAVVLVRNDGPGSHVFTVRVQLGEQANPVAIETVQVTAAVGQVGQAEVNVPTRTPDGRVQCQIMSIVDEHGATPVAGDPLPPPSDSAPMPAQPSPGQSTGPLPTPPNQSAPTPART